MYTDLIKNMLYDYIPNDKDYLPINKINTLIINLQILNSCLYHLYKLHNKELNIFDGNRIFESFPLKKFLIKVLEHNINMKYNKYNYSLDITKNKTLIDKAINNSLWILCNLSLANNINNINLYGLVLLDKQLNIHYTDHINNLYNYLIKLFNKKEYLHVNMDVVKYLYKYFNFSQKQKECISKELNKIKAEVLLNNL